MKVALLPKRTRGQTVRISMALRFGDERSLMGLREVSEFTAAMLDKGGAGLSRQQIQDRLDALKTELAISSGGDEVRVTDAVASRHRARCDRAARAICCAHRRSPPTALDELKRQTLAEIEAQRDDPQAIVANALARRGNPYPRGDVRHARSFDERLEDSQAVTLERVKDFHARFYGASQARFAAVGDIDAEARAPRADRRLWRLGGQRAGRARAAADLRDGAWPRSGAHTRQAERHVGRGVAPGAVGQRCRVSGADAGQLHVRQRRRLAPVEAHPRARRPVVRRLQRDGLGRRRRPHAVVRRCDLRADQRRQGGAGLSR